MGWGALIVVFPVLVNIKCGLAVYSLFAASESVAAYSFYTAAINLISFTVIIGGLICTYSLG